MKKSTTARFFSTGSAYDFRGSFSDQLAKEIGINMPLVDMPDPTIDNRTYVPDTWRSGLEHLPYTKEVVASFKKFRDDIMKIDIRGQMLELDTKPFSDITAAYAPEVAKWWDGYGPSNWGAVTEDTAAFIGVFDAQYLIKGEDNRAAFYPVASAVSATSWWKC